MKKQDYIQELIDNQDFKDWASSCYSSSHPFCTSSLFSKYTTSDIDLAKAICSSMKFTDVKLDLSNRVSLLKNIHTSIDTITVQLPETTQKVGNINSRKYTWMRVAASLVALVAVVFAFSSFNKVSIQTDYAEVVTQKLPDGSTVSLDANSSLEMLSNWSVFHDRKLKLTNSAFFDVTRKPKVGRATFSVYTDVAVVDVLGTEFYVDSDGDDLVVFVKSGKVRVRANDSQDFEDHILKAGEYLNIKDKKIVEYTKLGTTEIENNLAWTQGKMVFNNTSFSELTEIVKERFGYDLVVDPALMSSKKRGGVQGTFPCQTLEILLNSVSNSYDLQYTYVGNTIHLGYVKKD